jgi:hypothetical protein
MKYTKTITVEAIQFTRNNLKEVEEFVGTKGFIRYWHKDHRGHYCLRCHNESWDKVTLELFSNTGVEIGDVEEGWYIIKPTFGELDTIPEDLFKDTYKKVEE